MEKIIENADVFCPCYLGSMLVYTFFLQIVTCLTSGWNAGLRQCLWLMLVVIPIIIGKRVFFQTCSVFVNVC